RYIKHRHNAGTPDDSGWYLAKSTNGRFAVMFPYKFDDITTKNKEPDGAIDFMCMLVTTDEDENLNAKYMATAYSRSDGKPPRRLPPERAPERWAGGGGKVDKHPIEFAAHPALEFTVTGPDQIVHARAFRIDNIYYELAVVYSPTRANEKI